MNQKLLKGTLLVLGLAMLVGFLIFQTKWEKIEQEIGLSKEAYADPLLAANLFMKKHNVSLSTLKDQTDFMTSQKISLNQNGTLILDEAALNEYPNLEAALVDWVIAGGHLVYTLSPRRDLLELNNNALITQAEIQVVDSEFDSFRYDILFEPRHNIILKWHEDELKLNLPFSAFFEGCKGTAFHSIDENNVLICEQAMGKGFVTFIPSVFAISNSGLKHLDHGAFLLWLVGDSKHLFYLPSLLAPNWLMELWHWSWLFVVLFLISVVSIIWHLAIRFGAAKYPLHALKSPFADHIEAVGSFMVSQGHYEAMKLALIKDFEHKMEKRNPRFKALNLDEQAIIISQLTGKESQAIKALLTQAMPEQQEIRLQYIKLFKELRKAL